MRVKHNSNLFFSVDGIDDLFDKRDFINSLLNGLSCFDKKLIKKRYLTKGKNIVSFHKLSLCLGKPASTLRDINNRLIISLYVKSKNLIN